MLNNRILIAYYFLFSTFATISTPQKVDVLEEHISKAFEYYP